MPSAPKAAPIVLSIEPSSPEYKVVDRLRELFATHNAETGKTRRANGTDLVSQVISNVLLKATAETLDALSNDAANKAGSNGKEPKLKVKEVFQTIADARPVAGSSGGTVDVKKMTTEERARLLKEIEEANRLEDESRKAGKGTKNVAEI